MRIAVFLHGTAIMHAAASGVAREERVAQVRARDATVAHFASYVPTPGTVEKLREWSARGAGFVYLSSHRRADHLAADEQVVKRFGFPPGPVCGRRDGETYGELVSRLSPDLVVEDDCESIGGLDETIAAQLDQAARRSIPCLMLPEFGGFGHLPDDPAELARMQHMT